MMIDFSKKFEEVKQNYNKKIANLIERKKSKIVYKEKKLIKNNEEKEKHCILPEKIEDLSKTMQNLEKVKKNYLKIEEYQQFSKRIKQIDVKSVSGFIKMEDVDFYFLIK